MDKLQTTADKWNARYPPRTKVTVTDDSGHKTATKTSSWAQVLGGHTVVVWVDGITGCYNLERVHAALINEDVGE